VSAASSGAGQQVGALACVGSHRRRALKFGVRLIAPAEPLEQIPAHARQQVIAAQRGFAGQRVHDRQPGGWPVGHRYGDGAVELDHRRRRERRKDAVEGSDANPVGVRGDECPCVARGQRRLVRDEGPTTLTARKRPLSGFQPRWNIPLLRSAAFHPEGDWQPNHHPGTKSVPRHSVIEYHATQPRPAQNTAFGRSTDGHVRNQVAARNGGSVRVAPDKY
jgi:hypothetical protein